VHHFDYYQRTPTMTIRVCTQSTRSQIYAATFFPGTSL
jgi:hypothetical protein